MWERGDAGTKQEISIQPDIQKLNERLAKRRELETLLERFDREMSPEELEELLRDIREKYAEKHPGLVLPAHMRTYRDAVFRLLFNDKKSLLELYNALTDRSYTNPDDLIITTLNENIYISMNNDVSFIIGSELVLTEQQSSVCPNMALRFLLYIADLYRAMVDMKRLYSSTMQQVPMPRFIVFYNGAKSRKDTRWNHDEIEMKLSDCFLGAGEDISDENEPEHFPNLELKVRVLNINQGYNAKLLEKCKVLDEYSRFVDIVEKYVESETDIDKAVRKAVNYCIDNRVLVEFLKKNRDRVISMLISNYTSYDYEMDWQEEISQLKEQVAERDEQIAEAKEQVAERDRQIEELKEQLKLLQNR